MQLVRSFSIFLLVGCFSISAILAQQSSPSHTPAAQRDSQAVSAIQTALQTLGGAAAWAQVHDATETGACTDSTAQGANHGQFTWTVQGLNFRYQTMTSDGSQHVLASGHGKPARSDGNTTPPLSLRTASLTLPYQLPALVLTKALNETTYSLRYIGSATWDQAPAIQIEIYRTFLGHPRPETTQNWYFTPQTIQPMAVTFLISGEGDANHFAQFSYSFSNYENSNGLSVPQDIATGIVGTGFQEECAVQQIHFNTNPASSSFDLSVSTGGQN